VVVTLLALAVLLAIAWILFRPSWPLVGSRGAASPSEPKRAAPGATAALRLGVAYAERGEYAKAVAAFREALRLEPDLGEAWAGLGLIYDKLGQREPAITAFREVVRLEPDHAVAWCNLGVLYRRQNQDDLAAQSYREALRSQPAMVEAWLGLGVALNHQGRHGEALSAYREAVRLKPDSAKGWFNLGRLYEQDGEHAEAIAAYREAIRLKADDPLAWYNLAVLSREYGDPREAVKAFLEAIRFKPHDADAWYGLGMTYALQGDRDGTLEVYQQLAIVESAAAEEFAEKYMGSGGGKGAPAGLESSSELIDLTPRAPRAPGDLPSPADAWYGLGLMYRKQEQESEALEAFREAVRFDPDHAKAWYGLGTTCRKRGDANEALRAFQQVIRLKPDLPEVWQNVGAIHQEESDHAKAVVAFREAARLKPASIAAWYGFGTSSAFLGDQDGVAGAHQRLSGLDPGLADEFFRRYLSPKHSAPTTPSGPGAAAGGEAQAETRAAPNSDATGPPPDPSAKFKNWVNSLPLLDGDLPAAERRRKGRGRAAKRTS